jgi:hypothetical protein
VRPIRRDLGEISRLDSCFSCRYIKDAKRDEICAGQARVEGWRERCDGESTSTALFVNAVKERKTVCESLRRALLERSTVVRNTV